MNSQVVSIKRIIPMLERSHLKYWGAGLEQLGLFYLCWSNGEGWLLVPEAYEWRVNDMITAKNVIVIDGENPFVTNKKAIELVFEDGTDSPFFVAMRLEQCTQRLPKRESGIEFQLHIRTKNGKAGSLPGRFWRAS